MRGTVIRFNGRMGFLTGEDGNTYFIHEKFISEELTHTNRAKKVLSRLKNKTNAVEFTPVDTNKEHKEAHNLVFDLSPAGWVPQHTSEGYWIVTDVIRCSSCGHTADHKFKFCPHCGAKMIKEMEKGGK